MRRTSVFAGFLGLQVVLLAALFWHGRCAAGAELLQRGPDQLRLVAALQLTDLALWTEARYTRHPSQTDFFSAFQDFPGALEHFPAGSILAPPRFP